MSLSWSVRAPFSKLLGSKYFIIFDEIVDVLKIITMP
jgi:hypothetical protein